MLRSVLAAILGYLVMVVIALSGIWIAWLFLGGEGAFAGEGPYPSAPWVTINLVLGFLGALLAGWTAYRVGRSHTATKILIGIVLVLGLTLAVGEQLAGEERAAAEKPVADMSMAEAGRHARPPIWYAWVIPIVGAAGVAIGGRDRARAKAS